MQYWFGVWGLKIDNVFLNSFAQDWNTKKANIKWKIFKQKTGYKYIQSHTLVMFNRNISKTTD